MTVRRIDIVGCDNSTSLELDMTEAEYQMALRLAEAANHTSQESCQPTIWIDDCFIGREDKE